MYDLPVGRRAWLGGAGLLAAAVLLPATRLWAKPAFGSDPFTPGVAAGDPSPDGFVIWTRLAPRPLEELGGMPTMAVPVIWEVAEDDAFARTMLGARQEARLADGLGTPRRWNLIAQQVLVMPFDVRPDGAIEPAFPQNTWNGYREARQRLIRTITDRKLTNVVIATGDAHQHAVGHVPLDDRTPEKPAIAGEFMATSISSGGSGGLRKRGHLDMLDHNSNLALPNNQRGYQVHEISADRWDTSLRIVETVSLNEAPLKTLARFSVDPKYPGLQAA